MSVFLAALAEHYPDLVRQVEALDGIVGNRAVDVLELLARSDQDAEKLRAIINGATTDLVVAIERVLAHGPDPRGLGIAITLAILRGFQLGLWSAAQDRASLREDSLRRRLRAHDARPQGRA